MINLLPPELKSRYSFAHRNVGLRRWMLILLVTLIGLGGLATYGLLTLQQTTNANRTRVTIAENHLREEKLEQTKKQVQDITSSLKLSVAVLSKEVLFSKLISQIGAVMPSGTVLTGLNISKVGGGIDLTANATNYTTATQVQVNLSDPANKIFGKVDLISVTCSNKIANDPLHPCIVAVRALFNTDNQFLLINQGSKK